VLSNGVIKEREITRTIGHCLLCRWWIGRYSPFTLRTAHTWSSPSRESRPVRAP